MEAAGIKPITRIPSQWGDVLFGERYNKVHRGSAVVPIVQTFWFLSRDGIEVGRGIEFEHLVRPDGSIITREDRLMVAAQDAGRYLPVIMDGAAARREAVYGDFAKVS